MNTDCVQQAHWVNHDEELDQHRWREFRHLTTTAFSLPVNSALLYFIARGSLSHGTIEFRDDGESGNNNVVVDISFLYTHDVALDNIEVCRLQRDGSKNGVGISVGQFPLQRYFKAKQSFSSSRHL